MAKNWNAQSIATLVRCNSSSLSILNIFVNINKKHYRNELYFTLLS